MRRRGPVRQLGGKLTHIHAVVQMAEQKLADTKVARPTEYRIKVRVRGMRPSAEAIGDPHVHACIKRRHNVIQIVKVYCICKALPVSVEAHAKRADIAVGLIAEAHRGISNRAVLDHMCADH